MAKASSGCTIPYRHRKAEDLRSHGALSRRGHYALAVDYRLVLIGDPCVIVLLHEEGAVVVRFTHNLEPEVIRWAAEKTTRGLSKSRMARGLYVPIHQTT